MKRLVFILASALLVITGLTSPASATQTEHCLVHTDGIDKEGNLIVTSTTCYNSFADVLREAGATEVSSDVTPAQAGSYLMLTSIIGVHYDGFSASGSSFSVEGSDCAGGGLPVPMGWNDRISSTTNGCLNILHYENINYTGALETTYGAGNHNLGINNNKTSSIKYY